MNLRKVVCILAISAILAIGTSANAAVVGFLGSVDTGVPGMLGSLPRNFVLTLDYTPVPGGTAPATANITFPATPNADTTNPSTHSALAVTSAPGGALAVINDFGGTSDRFSFNGVIAAGDIGTNPVNFSFTFTKPVDTINASQVSEQNIAMLIGGQTTISFQGGGGPGVFTAQGVIRGAPEPSTMMALSALVVGGCGVGYRRRVKSKKESEEA